MRLAGIDGADTAFLILQHADLETQQKYLATFRQAVQTGHAWPSQLAMLEDRINIGHDRPQVYGTQLKVNKDGSLTPYPIEDPEYVDQRRQAVGLMPLADYLQLFEKPARRSDGLI